MPRVKLTVPQRLSDERREEINLPLEEKPQGILSFLSEQLNKLSGVLKKPSKPSVGRSKSTEVKDENLRSILSDCKFFLTVYKEGHLSDVDLNFHIGNIELKVIVNDEDLPLPNCNECWLYVSKIPGRSMLYYEWKNSDPSMSSQEDLITKYYQIEGLLDFSLFSGLHQSKVFSLVFTSSKLEFEEGIVYFNIQVYLHLNSKEESLSNYERPVNKNVQKVAGHFFNIYPVDEPRHSRREACGLQKDIEDLYDAVKAGHSDEMKIKIEEGIFHPSLLPILRPYQIAAVNWMLKREQLNTIPGSSDSEMDPAYRKVETLDGKDLYYNPYNGTFELEFPKAKPIPTGGVLADEMGLGKTVEVLACILSNPRKDLPSAEILEPIQILENSNEAPDEKEMGILLEASSENQMEDENQCPSMQHHSCEDTAADNMELDEENVPNSCNRLQVNINGITDEVEGDNAKRDCIADGEINEANEDNLTLGEVEVKAEMFEEETEANKCDVLKDETTEVKNDDVVAADNINVAIESDEIGEDKPKKSSSSKKNLKSATKPKPKKKRRRKKIVYDDSDWDDYDDYDEDYSYTPPKKPKVEKKATTKPAKAKKPAKVSEAKKAAQELYEWAMAEYSVTKYLNDKSTAEKRRESLQTQVATKSLFVCTCGMHEVEVGIIGNNSNVPLEEQQVQCNACYTWQHARCMGYDLKDPLRGEYYCPLCWQEREVVPSGATLIVSPHSIAFQWMDEIQHHVKKENLKVLYYKREQENGFVQPRVLARHDIVIVSYETLAKELNYLNIPHININDGRRLRYAKRFMAIPSPLPCVQWWRICLDEAQMVEVLSTKSAEMALRLSAVHRWCITGTPVQRSLNDLYGLVLFIDYFPYSVQLYWNSLLYHRYLLGDRKPFYEAISKVMWRSCKKDVIDQIRIPPQWEKVYWLKFCPTEEHFYRKQHLQCSRSALSALAPFEDNIKLDSLDRQSLSKILNPLLSLRQACCHPQAVKVNNRGQLQTHKADEWSMEHLLSSLVSKAKVEAEEALRMCVAALNGLAGVHIILGDWSLAEDKYRQILKLSDEYKDHLKVDTLQKIHTLHNLAGILDNGVSASSTQLREEAQELEMKYLNRCSKKVLMAKEAVSPFTKAVESILNGPLFQQKKPWWVQVIDCCTKADLGSELVRKVKNDLSDYMSMAGKAKVSSKINNVSDEGGLRYVLSEKLEYLYNKRESILSEMKELLCIESNPTEASRLVMIAVDCHLRLSTSCATIVSVGAKRKTQSDLYSSVNKEGNKRKSVAKGQKSTKCDLCEANTLLEQYEAYLFKVLKEKVEGEAVLLGDVGDRKETHDEDDAQAVKVFGQLSRGNWADGEIERILKVILGFAKTKKFNQELIRHGNNQIKLMEAMKKEYKYLRVMWRQLNDQVSAIDELNMAKLRLGLKEKKEVAEVEQKNKSMKGLSNKPESKVESIHLLGQHELEPYADRLAVELASGSCDLRKRMGQLFYLQNLVKANSGRHGGVNPDPCPICHKVLGEKWSVLHCGHCYCMECIKTVIAQYCSRGRTIKCAICREITHQSEVSYVDTSGGPPGESCEEGKDEKSGPEEGESSKAIRKLFEVKGSHSTKVEAVVRTLLSLIDHDPEVKVLVFSSFSNILEIIGKALIVNDIKYAHGKNHTQFQESINLFKDPDRDVTALLLKVSSGSKGLNLIEATHVLLVEPNLNVANELQAVGRVHRIGQTRPTVVHRFLVRNTIEERIHSVLHGGHHKQLGSDSSTAPQVTIGDLRLIFESESKQDGSLPSSIIASSTANSGEEDEDEVID
ncbi:E3 ubiquitin-protein ligase SHPRH isoform X2 [Ischnura elegans]|uniref:E3 ubiquitin-protein ligase SHPRH isoform X2 n=1 Tax=Ischnura elegans TaxID=197161 RepID=UPI001ED8BD1B|nr:E3 ubiquitin-protein ligase SHPRH isoform X2 [Ischnura elegans]